MKEGFSKVERAYKAWLCMCGVDDFLTNTELALITEYVKWSESNVDGLTYYVDVTTTIRKRIMHDLNISSDTLTLYTRKLVKHGVMSRGKDRRLDFNFFYVCAELRNHLVEARNGEFVFVDYSFGN
jgi:hypothetical protein